MTTPRKQDSPKFKARASLEAMRGSMPETVETAEQEERQEQEKGRCPVVMSDGKSCGRPIYQAPPSVDERPVCLMHSRDPSKDKAAFQQEIERILSAGGIGLADFSHFVFPAASYGGRKFRARCIFYRATFTQRADFIGATFTQEAHFLGATFTQQAHFGGATFTQRANFVDATFTQEADFIRAVFTKRADFWGATFTQEANFRGATFTQEADFIGATFTEKADFSHAKFKNFAGFESAEFLSSVHFRETEFRKDGGEIGAVFSLAWFEKPEAVVFYKTYLGQVLFHNCDISRVNFSNVEWRRRPDNQKRMLFEEVVKLDKSEAEALKPAEGSEDDLNYGLIAELYQQLKKNFDDRKDYWTAGDFHYGEMEMKRRASRHPYLGLAAWYKRWSEYGESYVRPLVWLGIVLLVFAVLYPWAGLDAAAGRPDVSYWNFTTFLAQHNWAWWSVLAFFGHSLIAALSVMALQRDLVYQPSYPWGRLLALLELVLTSTLVALFLLAVRRQFRR